MQSLTNTTEEYLTKIQGIIGDIRDWNEWSTEPLSTMRSVPGSYEAGALALYAYSRYVRRFIPIMCAILSKVPEADDRFWRLAVNLYDELGGSQGFIASHGKLLEGVDHRPDTIPETVWNSCAIEMDILESELMHDFSSLEWPLNLFALGSGTESISDLFLDPIEMWSSVALDKLPRKRSYFDVHRPDVEYEHQMEISRVLSEELNNMTSDAAQSLFTEGRLVAERAARRHYRATYLCWSISTGHNPIH